MNEFISSYPTILFFSGGLAWLIFWFACVMYLTTGLCAMPIVESIRAKGGEAPSSRNVFISFGIVALICFCLSILGFYTTINALHFKAIGTVPNSTWEGIREVLTLNIDDTFKYHLFFGLAICSLVWSIPSGYYHGVRNAENGRC